MPRQDDSDFEPRLGRVRDRGARAPRRPPTFIAQVMREVGRSGGDPRRIGKPASARSGTQPRTGRFNARGRGARVARAVPRESGWQYDAQARMRFRSRRAIVKARVVKMRGAESQAAAAHVLYLQRDGVTRDGEPGRLYNAWTDDADGDKFLGRGREDRHQFRLIVSAEDAPELGDLRSFTRQLMAQMQRDLCTELDWVATDHFNTGRPHTHIVIRGVTEDGTTLNIAGDYIAHGIRHRASEIMTLTLGPQTEWELQQSLGREIDQERFTRLDRTLVEQAGAERNIDLHLDRDPSHFGAVNPHMLLARLRKLERMKLAEERAPGQWMLAPEMEPTLREMGERGDIIKTMHRAVTELGVARSYADYTIDREADPSRTMIGRVLGKGLAMDELSGNIHLVVDGTDGRVHYAEVLPSAAAEARIGSIVEIGKAMAPRRRSDRNIDELARDHGGIYEPSLHLEHSRYSGRVPDKNYEGYVQSHVRRLEALRRAGIVERIDADHWSIPVDYLDRAQDYDTQRSKQLGFRVVSFIDLETQVAARGATWLDRELVARDRTALAMGGFGSEVREALKGRARWLVEHGLATEKGNRALIPGDTLRKLTQLEIREAGEKIAQRKGWSYYTPIDGVRVDGTYRGSVNLVSGRFAVVEKSREFTLVPWRPVIEKELGRYVSGIPFGDSFSWELGRQRSRGLDIGM
jgi:type IV secretory pathway VirD2 relaxase